MVARNRVGPMLSWLIERCSALARLGPGSAYELGRNWMVE